MIKSYGTKNRMIKMISLVKYQKLLVYVPTPGTATSTKRSGGMRGKGNLVIQLTFTSADSTLFDSPSPEPGQLNPIRVCDFSLKNLPFFKVAFQTSLFIPFRRKTWQ